MSNENNIVPYTPDEGVTKDFFTHDEEKVLSDLMGKRLAILNDMFEEGKPPSDNATRRVAKELIESAETAIVNKGMLRAKIKKDQDDTNVQKAVVAETLRIARLNASRQNDYVGADPDRLPEEVFDGEVFVPGETELERIELSPDEFIGDKK